MRVVSYIVVLSILAALTVGQNFVASDDGTKANARAVFDTIEGARHPHIYTESLYITPTAGLSV